MNDSDLPTWLMVYIVAISHLLAWPSVRYWMVYRKVQWRDGPTGRALFNKARSLALLLIVSLVGYWWPFPGYPYLYAAGLTYLTAAVWYQYRVMRRLLVHRDERQRILAHYTVHSEGAFDEATPPVRQDDSRRQDRRLADEGSAAQG